MNPHFPPDLPDDFDSPVRVDSPLPRIFDMIRNLDRDEHITLALFINSITPTENVDVRRQLTFQLQQAQQLQAETMTGRSNPTQKASALRVTGTVLKQLIELESAVYNITRVKQLEEALRLTLNAHEDGKALMETFRTHFKRLEA